MNYLISSKKNRRGPDFQGSFTVEFTNNADTGKVPPCLMIGHNLLLIADGWCHVFAYEIKVVVGDHELVWPSEDIRVVRDTDGDILWINPDYQELREILADALVK